MLTPVMTLHHNFICQRLVTNHLWILRLICKHQFCCFFSEHGGYFGRGFQVCQISVEFRVDFTMNVVTVPECGGCGNGSRGWHMSQVTDATEGWCSHCGSPWHVWQGGSCSSDSCCSPKSPGWNTLQQSGQSVKGTLTTGPRQLSWEKRAVWYSQNLERKANSVLF